jgi:short-subunit dehydrogenase
VARQSPPDIRHRFAGQHAFGGKRHDVEMLRRWFQRVGRVLPGRGKIINVSSIGGLLALPYNSTYAASKFAPEGYSASLRLELLEDQIYVSLVEPGPVRTDTLDTSRQQVTTGHPLSAQARAAMVDTMRQSGLNSGVAPGHVAGAVAQIVAARRPRLRYPVGALARWVPVRKTVLPQSIFEWVAVQQFLRPVQA